MRRSRSPRGLEEPTLLALKCKGSQAPRCVSPCINSYPIVPLDHVIADGVTVNHQKPMVASVAQEGLSDPAQIALHLVRKGDPGADARVDEQIITNADCIMERLKESLVARRDRRFYHPESLRIVRISNLSQVDAIARKRLLTAES